MIRFKELFSSAAHHDATFVPSVSLTLSDKQTLHLKFDKKDTVEKASYNGKVSPWFSGLCEILPGKNLETLQTFGRSDFDQAFADDQSYWDLKQEDEDDLFFEPIELLKAAVDHYRGRDYLYEKSTPLICRCFGVREGDVRDYLKKDNEPTLEKLASATKASLGCRSCLPQLKRWLAIETSAPRERVYKNKPIADWLLEIDYMLSCFPMAADWEMQVESFKNRQVVVTFKKEASQRELEETGIELQRFLAAGVDDGLSFFLRRA